MQDAPRIRTTPGRVGGPGPCIRPSGRVVHLGSGGVGVWALLVDEMLHLRAPEVGLGGDDNRRRPAGKVGHVGVGREHAVRIGLAFGEDQAARFRRRLEEYRDPDPGLRRQADGLDSGDTDRRDLAVNEVVFDAGTEDEMGLLRCDSR